jgi:mycothiol synthase
MVLRPPGPGDASAVLELMVARDVTDFGLPDYTLEDLHAEWRSSEIDLATDAAVIEDPQDPSRLAGYAIVRRGEILVAVHPDAEGRGVGAELLAWGERVERDRGRELHRQRIPAGNHRAQALLTAAGYHRRRSHWRMVLALTGGVPTLPVPHGTVLRELDIEADAVALHELDAVSFSGNADYEPETLEQFREEHLQAHDLDPALSRVLRAGDTLVGFLLARRWDEDAVGYVDVLGVHPDHRRRGLATAMLLSAFSAFAAAGLREAQLGVASDNPRALGLYERIGMTPGFRIDAYERLIGEPAGA